MYNVGSKIIGHLEKADRLVNNKFQYPISCEIDPSNKCQNNCTWCIYKDYIKENRKDLDWFLYCDIVKSLYKSGCKSITFTGGGEPLMHPKIEAMVKVAYDLGFEIGFITNGIALDRLFPVLDCIKFIRVSVDAISPIMYKNIKKTNSFSRICHNIKKAVNKSIKTDIGISMVYEKGMEREASLFSELGEELGVKYAQVKTVINPDTKEHSDDMDKLNNGFITKRYMVDDDYTPCKLAGLIGQVAADGCFYYCCIHRGNKKYKIGDFSKDGYKDIIEKRIKFKPCLKDCFSCRYMNYAKEYKKVSDKKYQMLRHINFL